MSVTFRSASAFGLYFSFSSSDKPSSRISISNGKTSVSFTDFFVSFLSIFLASTSPVEGGAGISLKVGSILTGGIASGILSSCLATSSGGFSNVAT